MNFTVTDLGVFPGGSSSRSEGIFQGLGGQGDTVGAADDSSGTEFAFYFNRAGAGLVNLGDLSSSIVFLASSRARAAGRFGGTGFVVGSSGDPLLLGRATLWQPGLAPVDMGTLLGFGPSASVGLSEARGANDNGQAVGVATAGIGIQHAVLWSIPGVAAMQDLSTLWAGGQGNSEANAISSNGWVAGVSDIADTDPGGRRIRHAFLVDPFSGQPMRDLGTLLTHAGAAAQGGGDSVAFGVNNAGQVVGRSDSVDANGNAVQRAFLYDPNAGTMTDLGTLFPSVPGDQGDSVALSINGSGVIVGWAQNGPASPGVLPQGGFMLGSSSMQMTDLNPLPGGWISTSADGIDDSGRICATGENPAIGVVGPHALLLSP